MFTALLRTGDLKEFNPIGEDGVSVISVASQFRETVRIRLGQEYVDYLAIPQRNEKGDVIDWYVPFESDRADGEYSIIPWTSATENEKSAARDKLDQFSKKLLALGNRLGERESNLEGDQKLFLHLLCDKKAQHPYDINNLRAVRFPDDDYVYLVNGKPVITFWGFNRKTAVLHGDPFLCLRMPEAASRPPQATAINESEVKPAVAATSKRRHGCLLWLLPLLLLLLLLFLAWYFWLRLLWLPKPTAPVSMPTTASQGKFNLPDVDLGKFNLPDFNLSKVVPPEKISTVADDKLEPDDKVEKNIIYRNGKPVGFVGHNGKYNYVNDPQWFSNLLGNLNAKSDSEDQADNANVMGPAELPSTDATQENVAADGAAGTPDLNSAEDDKTKSSETGNAAQSPDGDAATDTQSSTDTATSQEGATNNAGQEPSDDAGSTSQPANDAGSTSQPANDATTNAANSTATENARNSVTNPFDPSADDSKDALVIPSSAKNSNDSAFLNNKKLRGAGLQDERGNPVKINYDFDNSGQGKVNLTRSDGVTCSAGVTKNMANGELSISSNSNANCSDNTTYKVPAATCREEGGRTKCLGDNGDGKKFPFYINSKIK